VPENPERYDLSELMGVYRKKLAFIQEGARKGIKIDGDKVEVKGEDAAAIAKAHEEAVEIKGLMDKIHLSNLGVDIREGTSDDVESIALKAGVPSNIVRKSLGDLFTGSQEFKDFRTRGGYTMNAPYELDAFDVGGMGRKDVWGMMAPGTIQQGFGRTQFDPMVPRGQRQYRVRDLFPVAATSANLIDYFRVVGFAENSGVGSARSVRDRAAADGVAAPVGNATDTFGLKPKSNLTFINAQAPVRTIAHWEAAHRNVLDDEPQLQATINNELLYGLALEEDRQILNGSGANEELLGILQTPGIQSYTPPDLDAGAGVLYEKKADSLRRAATLAVIANYPVTGYVLHPNDWEDIELDKDTQGRYIFVSNVAVGLETRVWRQPVVDTPAIPEGTALTGAFGTGAQLYDRQMANIRIAEQHADFFVRNAIAILCEERLALAVKRPESFIKITFPVGQV
jgi:hypothetical protein